MRSPTQTEPSHKRRNSRTETKGFKANEGCLIIFAIVHAADKVDSVGLRHDLQAPLPFTTTTGHHASLETKRFGLGEREGERLPSAHPRLVSIRHQVQVGPEVTTQGILEEGDGALERKVGKKVRAFD